MIRWKQIGEAKINRKNVIVFRNKYGKFYVEINGIITQRELTAEEIVRYLLNARNK